MQPLTHDNCRYWFIKVGLLAMETLLVAVSVFLAYLIRFDFNIWPDYQQQLVCILPTLLLVRLSVFYYTRTYRYIWKYSSINDLLLLAKAVAIGSLLWAGISLLKSDQWGWFIGIIFFASAIIHRAVRSKYPDFQFSKFLIFTSCFGASLLLLGAYFIFAHYHSAPVYISQIPFFQLFIPATWESQLSIPRSVLLLEGILSFFLIGMLRISHRVWFNVRFRNNENGIPLLIFGAGDQGENVLRGIMREPGEYKVVGFIDDNPAKMRNNIHGLPVLGDRHNIEKIFNKYGVKELLIAIAYVEDLTLKEIAATCNEMGVSIRRLPHLSSLIKGQSVKLEDFRVINTADLLGRSEVQLNPCHVKAYVEHRVILVTGAGGSIGSEICRQVCKFDPKKIVVLGKGESSIFSVKQELEFRFPRMEIECVICDIRNKNKIEKIFERFRPDVVFHAAAHKHVHFMEHDIDEAISTNVFGTRNILNTSGEYCVDKFVMISTDKAVRPTSMMGASKRLGELLVQRTADIYGDTSFVIVRFGNVLGSRGSVVPIFEEQIRNGGPVTVTHSEMTRYFMSIPEAVSLVLHSAVIGGLCILDMGEPVKILDLAKNMIRLAGLEPNKDIDIVFSGIKPGEKLFEELVTDEQATTLTTVGKIHSCQPTKIDKTKLDSIINKMEFAVSNCDLSSLIELMEQAVPNYTVNDQTLARANQYSTQYRMTTSPMAAPPE